MQNKSHYGLGLKAFFALFAVVTLVFVAWPDLDLVVHRGLYDTATRTFPGQEVWLFQFAADAVEGVVVAAALAPLSVWLWNRFRRQAVLGVTGRVYAYLVLSLALGPGCRQISARGTARSHQEMPRWGSGW